MFDLAKKEGAPKRAPWLGVYDKASVVDTTVRRRRVGVVLTAAPPGASLRGSGTASTNKPAVKLPQAEKGVDRPTVSDTARIQAVAAAQAKSEIAAKAEEAVERAKEKKLARDRELAAQAKAELLAKTEEDSRARAEVTAKAIKDFAKPISLKKAFSLVLEAAGMRTDGVNLTYGIVSIGISNYIKSGASFLPSKLFVTSNKAFSRIMELGNYLRRGVAVEITGEDRALLDSVIKASQFGPAELQSTAPVRRVQTIESLTSFFSTLLHDLTDSTSETFLAQREFKYGLLLQNGDARHSVGVMCCRNRQSFTLFNPDAKLETRVSRIYEIFLGKEASSKLARAVLDSFGGSSELTLIEAIFSNQPGIESGLIRVSTVAESVSVKPSSPLISSSESVSPPAFSDVVSNVPIKPVAIAQDHATVKGTSQAMFEAFLARCSSARNPALTCSAASAVESVMPRTVGVFAPPPITKLRVKPEIPGVSSAVYVNILRKLGI